MLLGKTGVSRPGVTQLMPALRKQKRILIYWLDRLFSLSLPVGLLDLATSFFVSRGLGNRPYRGIVTMAFPPHKVDALSEIVEALELIRRHDPRRFTRVERFIKRIFLANYSFAGRYSPFGHVCGLQKLAVPDHLRSLATYHYAATLVHEATHAMLFAKRFPYTRTTLPRIEKLCVKEEARFLVRFPDIDRKLELTLGYVAGIQKKGTICKTTQTMG